MFERRQMSGACDIIMWALSHYVESCDCILLKLAISVTLRLLNDKKSQKTADHYQQAMNQITVTQIHKNFTYCIS